MQKLLNGSKRVLYNCVQVNGAQPTGPLPLQAPLASYRLYSARDAVKQKQSTVQPQIQKSTKVVEQYAGKNKESSITK
jgi:hypothetical protein